MDRVFVFRESHDFMTRNKRSRPLLYAFRESEIKTINSQLGSENCYLIVNGIEVEGSFDDLVKTLGERINIT